MPDSAHERMSSQFSYQLSFNNSSTSFTFTVTERYLLVILVTRDSVVPRIFVMQTMEGVVTHHDHHNIVTLLCTVAMIISKIFQVTCLHHLTFVMS